VIGLRAGDGAGQFFRVIGIAVLFAGWAALVLWLFLKWAEFVGFGKGWPTRFKIQKLFSNDKKAG